MTGTLVEWVEALGTWASAVLAIPAIWLAIRADQLAKISAAKAEQLEAERLELERRQDERLAEYEAMRQALAEEQHQADILRERRELAGQLQVWWVANQRAWGGEYLTTSLIIRNEGKSPCIFRNVSIGYSAKDTDTLGIAEIPPGIYMCRYLDDSFDQLTALNHEETFDPLPESAGFSVNSLEYFDALGDHWIWTPDNGLNLAP